MFNFTGALSAIVVPIAIGALIDGSDFAPALMFIAALALVGIGSYLFIVGRPDEITARDYLMRRGVSASVARKLPVLLGLTMTLFILGASYTDNTTLIVLFMSLAFFGNGLATITWVFVTTLARQMLCNRRLLGICLGQFSISATFWFFLTWFPTYLVRYRHMDFIKSGYVASLPYLAAFCGVLLAGFIFAFGWRGLFAITGLTGILWAGVWFALYREPGEHKRVSAAERAWLLENGALPDSTSAGRTPLRLSDVRCASSVAALVGLRLGVGALEAPVMPANNRIISGWFPLHERASAIGIYSSAQFAGLACVTPLLFHIEDNLAVAAPALSAELQLTPLQMGLIFSAFGWIYAALQIPGGWLIDRLGARMVYGVAMIGWSLITLLHGLITTGLLKTALCVSLDGYSLFPGTLPMAHDPLSSGAPAAGVRVGRTRFLMLALVFVNIIINYMDRVTMPDSAPVLIAATSASAFSFTNSSLEIGLPAATMAKPLLLYYA
ncbi:hypothetical protein CRX72_03590 [Pantoea sp. BRM17]|nr:hypothetical protein CRX72_03590 [Pantoea sp. BRM17]